MDKPRGRPFEAGNTFGQGRPKGSPNRGKSEKERILEEFAPHLIRKCIALALNGDRTSLRICMDRVSAPRREGAVKLKFSPLRKAADINEASEKVTQAIRRGELTLPEGEALMGILETRLRLIERTELEQRLEKLEKNIQDNESREGRS